MRHSTDNLRGINSIHLKAGSSTITPVTTRVTVSMNGGLGNQLNFAGTNANANINKFNVTRTNSTTNTGELDTYGTVSTAPSTHQLSDGTQHHVADGNGYHGGSPTEDSAIDTGSTSRHPGLDSSEKTLSTLDDIMESPLLKTPVEKWLEAQDRALDQMKINEEQNRRYSYTTRNCCVF